MEVLGYLIMFFGLCCGFYVVHQACHGIEDKLRERKERHAQFTNKV
jgi:hypothetical protein